MFATVIATPSYDMGTNDRYTTPGTYIIQNTDKLVTNSSYHRDYTRGGKTGSLGEWQNFAGWHSQNGESYISVLLNVPYDADPEGMRPRAGGDRHDHGLGVRHLHHRPGAGHDPAHHPRSGSPTRPRRTPSCFIRLTI